MELLFKKGEILFRALLSGVQEGATCSHQQRLNPPPLANCEGLTTKEGPWDVSGHRDFRSEPLKHSTMYCS
jgi:hypothetical protein